MGVGQRPSQDSASGDSERLGERRHGATRRAGLTVPSRGPAAPGLTVPSRDPPRPGTAGSRLGTKTRRESALSVTTPVLALRGPAIAVRALESPPHPASPLSESSLSESSPADSRSPSLRILRVIARRFPALRVPALRVIALRVFTLSESFRVPVRLRAPDARPASLSKTRSEPAKGAAGPIRASTLIVTAVRVTAFRVAIFGGTRQGRVDGRQRPWT